MEQASTKRALLGDPRLPSRPDENPQAYERLRTMRETSPVVRGGIIGIPAWEVFGYDDALTVLTDHARFSSVQPLNDLTLVGDTLVAKDPPDHRKLRGLVNMAFTPRPVARLSGLIEATTAALLDALRARGDG